MLIPDLGDKSAVEAVLKAKGITWDQARSKSPGWIWRRVRRYIPQKDILHTLLSEFFNAWANVKCSVTKLPLFSDETRQKSPGVLNDVLKGWVSDPAGIPLYTVEGMDKNHLTLYHCPRGTNSVEGAVHNPLRRNFAALNASPELADSLAADWRHRHNVDCGALHKNNLKYSGHYDPWIDDDIFRLRADIEWNESLLIFPQRVIQDTSPLSFSPTHEQFGITGIPLTLRAKNDFLGPGHDTIEVEVASVYPERLHLSTLKAKRDNIYAYLAHAQKTKFAVTPVHTQDEFDLYHTAMTPGGDFFSLQGKVNFDRMATWWSTQADGKKIFYKLKEHLESHHKVWEGLRRSQDSLLSSREQRRPSRRRIQAATHVSHVLPAAARDNPGVIPAEDLISESMPDQLPPVNTNFSGSQGADDGSTQMQIPMEVDFLDIVSHPSDPLPDANYRGSTPMPYNTQPWHGIGQTLEFWPTYWPQQALASGSSQMNFVSYTGPPNPGTKRQRKCQNCVAAGESGYNCRGESGRKRCKLLPCTEIVQENSGI
ncbi:hypothetical protein C8J57DRAFT_1483194 [Mycena rebaudengoi]|nr:hypothetical protein C8J57DRAFT_1483194 [Mycena rebaudengoi]